MRIGMVIPQEGTLSELTDVVGAAAEAGFTSAWATQIFGFDALTLLALVGAQVPGIELCTGVVPVYPRHPQVLAQQALTVQAATGGRLALGIGLSHQMVVEGMWGYSYEKPARYMREYLMALVPMLHGEVVSVEGEAVTARTIAPLDVPGAVPPQLLVAALGPTMLGITGRLADGTVTWMTGVRTVGDHIVPTITESAAGAGKGQPRVAVLLPATVTDDAERARDRIDRAFAIYPSLPSYRAMMDREGAGQPSDVAIVGTEAEVAAKLRSLSDAGATDFVALVMGTPDEKKRTNATILAAGS